MRLSRRLWLLAVLTIFTTACSNSGSDDDSNVRQGRFVDSPVSGLHYVSTSGQDQTDIRGIFEYTPGDIIDFYIGGVTGIYLGSAEGTDFITPLDLLDGGDNHRIAINIARLLMALDADGDHANGIQLSEAAIDAAKGLSLSFSSFDVDYESFPPDSLLNFVQANVVNLPDSSAAEAHIACTLQDIEAGREPDGVCDPTSNNSNTDGGMNNTDGAGGGSGNGGNGGAGTSDADNDGVNDPVDQCPDTPAGESVDGDGCSDAQNATDSDGDGVNDSQDQCPNTPQGENVNPNGCSSTQQGADADSDGVKNPLDLCPGTPSGESVDANGCSQSQLDDDGDGVSNANDQCAGTPEGEFVNGQGCSASQLCTGELLCVGTAKRSVAPSDKHIAGVEETRVYADPQGNVGAKPQKFSLGGYGLEGDAPDSTDVHIGAGYATGNYRDIESDGNPHSTYVRVMVVEEKDGEVIAFITLDAIGAGNIIQNHLKAAVTAATGIPPENILFGQTHSHSAADLQGLWGGVPVTWLDCDDSRTDLDGCGVDDAWTQGLYQLAADAAREAMNKRVPSNLNVATGEVNRNRTRTMQVTRDQTTDKAMTVLQAVSAADGQVVGTIMQYAAHPTILNSSNRDVHTDYVLSALVDLESQYGGTALYYNGPIADVAPSGGSSTCPEGGESRYCRARNYGKDLANDAINILSASSQSVQPTLTSRSEQAVLPVTNPLFLGAGLGRLFNRYYNFVETPVDDVPEVAMLRNELPQVAPFATTTVSRVTLGDPSTGQGLEIATIPGEGRNSMGQLIRHLASSANRVENEVPVMLLGLTHNSFGYIVPEKEFGGAFHQGELYEEVVSLGPLTAPLLRVQAYFPLFEAPQEAYVPDYLRSCEDSLDSDACILDILKYRTEETPLSGVLEQISDGCRDFNFPEPVCGLFDTQVPPGGDEEGGSSDVELILPAADAQARGCDILDTSHCMYPFPNNHFTVEAPAGSPQAVGGTGLRVNFNILGMPRNIAGKPIDPTEWNRNDGFSPGQMIVTYVPDLNLDQTTAVPLTNLAAYEDSNAPIMVIDTTDLTPHMVWAEMDANAGILARTGDAGGPEAVDNPREAQSALLIRPAVNFKEGHRYVVILRNLKDSDGNIIPAGAGMKVCRDGVSQLPPIAERCSYLKENVFDVVDWATSPSDEVFLAWDFTVASTKNNIGRLREMRDDAFASLSPDPSTLDCTVHQKGCARPDFTVDKVTMNPKEGIAKRIEGTIKVPSYMVPMDASPFEDPQFQSALNQIQDSLPAEFAPLFEAGGIAQGGSLPPNRLNYDPTDNLNPNDPLGNQYGDGLPDRVGGVGEMTTRYICQVPEKATPGTPARPGVYGHGLLDGRMAITYDKVPEFSREHNFLFCAVDLYGFSTGDLPNVASALIDFSNFPVIPDASQQGVLNFTFLARLLAHPEGFAAHEEFQVAGQPVFTPGEVFYDGNSQGGITGGVIVAASKDIKRGVLGVPGMNYSTLLRRSVDFDLYSVPVYLSYQDDLDRNFLFSIMQMLWDRSENNGYAHHITDNRELEGPDNKVLLHPGFGDHQVTMWSADVMARTIGASYDFDFRAPASGQTYTFTDEQDFLTNRHPDNDPWFGLVRLDYDNSEMTAGSAIVTWDEGKTAAPPVGNTAPRADDHDPHGYPRALKSARCEKSHFLHYQGALIAARDVTHEDNCPALPSDGGSGGDGDGDAEVFDFEGRGTGVLGTVADLGADSNDIVMDIAGDPAGLGDSISQAIDNLSVNLQALLTAEEGSLSDIADNSGNPNELLTDLGEFIGLHSDPVTVAAQAAGAERSVEPVVLTGAQLPGWSVPAAFGVGYPYPSGAITTGVGADAVGMPGEVRDAHNGVLLYPPAGQQISSGVPVNEIAAYRYDGSRFVEIPVQVDERMPYFLANAGSEFSIYSGTDPELSYVWDNGDPHTDGVESWKMTSGVCNREYADGEGPVADPISGLDNDDEIVFMASDAGELYQGQPEGEGWKAVQLVALLDPLDPAQQRFVYLVHKEGGSSFTYQNGYVDYQRHANADQWVDSTFFKDHDPERLGSSNTGYGPNLSGKVCLDGTESSAKESSDRFPRDGVVVTTDTYRWEASGRWMVRDLRIKHPDAEVTDESYWQTRKDIVDRWKGRAFQQSPDSTISVVGFEDEQVNWEANSGLLGERRGPVRAIREVWGADSGTNVTKTESFYRDVATYQYRVRVHPIPADGLYTSWDYNRSAMVPEAGENVEEGRYFTVLRPQGVPIDGINDDLGNVDALAPFPGVNQCLSLDDNGPADPGFNGKCPAFFDAADPTFNAMLAFDNWEQISAKGDLGSLVYTFELVGATSVLNPLVVPYYRDDACLDDGTGDDPMPRVYPGDSYDGSGGKVRNAYEDQAGVARGSMDFTGGNFSDCIKRQGAHGSHGVHYFFTHDTDNLFTPTDSTVIDARQWQFMVPTHSPKNIGEPYANTVRVKLVPVVVPMGPPGGQPEYVSGEPSGLPVGTPGDPSDAIDPSGGVPTEPCEPMFGYCLEDIPFEDFPIMGEEIGRLILGLFE